MKMPLITDLRDLLRVLRQEKQLAEINCPVDPDQEIAEIHRRVIAAEGPALLFKNVKGSPFPVVTNLFGTEGRVERAFGHDPLEAVRQMVDVVHHMLPPKIEMLWRSRHLLRRGLHLGTKKTGNCPVREVCVNPPNLNQLPLLKLWPEDGGAFITLPIVYTEDPTSRIPNLGIYRMQRFDSQTTGMHWQIGKGGRFHYNEASRLGKALPVSVFIGGPPALILSTIAPLPEGVPEVLLTGFLLGKKLPIFRDEKTNHPVPAQAEFALLGEVQPDELRPEGPFGDHYGYYSLTHDFPVFHCQQVYHRRDAIYPATVVGKPRQEDFYLGNYIQALLSPLFPLVMPSVVDLWSYGETGFHSLSAAVVKERYRREAMMSAFRILGEGQLSLTKFLLLTDQKINLQDFPKVLEHILRRCRWETDLYILSNLSMDTLDYAGPRINEGSKGVLMGLGEPIRDLPDSWEGEPPLGGPLPKVFCPGCLVVGGPGYEEDPGYAQHLAEHPSLQGWQLVILCDAPEFASRSAINFLWTAFTRFEPVADLHAQKTSLHRHHLLFEPPIVLDARMKPWYPREVSADPDVARKVDQRWKEYFPEGGVTMGSSHHGHLTSGA